MRKFVLLLISVFLLAACVRTYQPDLNADWSLTVETTDSVRTHLVIPSSEAGTPVVRKGLRKTEVTYPSVGGKNIEVCFTYSGKEKARQVVPTVTNREEGWVVIQLSGPEVRDLGIDVEKMKLLVPEGAGLRFDLSKAEATNGWTYDKEKKCFNYRRPYPCRHMTMQWAEFFSGEQNLYIASHDPEFRWKVFDFKYYPEDQRVAFHQENRFTCFSGETWSGPPTLLSRTEGSWKEGSKTYRDWFLSVRPLLSKSDWIRKNSGWLLTILRQQNDELMWPYPEVGTDLLEAAEKRGIDIVSLFGWTAGGHDRFYPDYIPDPRMGGKEALMESIRKIHEHGKRVTVYANGQLLDKDSTQFWPDTGRFISVELRNHKLRTSKFWKYRSAGGREFGLGCYQTEVWRNRLLRLALQAHELGADGIIFDQLGVQEPEYCYAAGHGHTSPTVGYERDRTEVLEWISAELKKRNPDFLVMTEGLADCELNGVGMFHGYSTTSTQGPVPANIRHTIAEDSFFAVFPDMFRYTFPEGDCTIRKGNPASTRASLNFGTAFGYKHEIECRYAPDKRYLVEGTIPTWDDYGDVMGPPSVPEIQSQDPAEVVRYSKAVMDLRRKYEDLLYVGNFISDDGFTLDTQAPFVLARAFINGNKMCVVVWNVSDEAAADFTVTPDKGWKLSETAAPEGEPSEGPLPAQSIRVMLFER